MPRGMTGAIPAPRERIASVPHFVPLRTAATEYAVVPTQLDYWGNNQYGDCVTAEEAFKCATDVPEDFIRPDIVITWARKHGFLNGAMLPDVMDAMQKEGFLQDGRKYGDGPYTQVNYKDETNLKLAIATATVKIAIDSRALPSGAGNDQGWYSLGGSPNHFQNTDHCVALTGYGTAGYLYERLKVPLPSAINAAKEGYLLFTWSTIGFVDHAWILSTCTEAYVRNPQTVFDPPQPTPPPTPPTPTPNPWWQFLVNLWPTLMPIILPIIIAFLQSLLKKHMDDQQKGSSSSQ